MPGTGWEPKIRIAGWLILHLLGRTQIILLGGGSNARCLRGPVIAWQVALRLHVWYFFRTMARWTVDLGINKAKRRVLLRWL